MTDLAFETVRDSLLRTATRGSEATGRWEKALDQAARAPEAARIKPFTGGETDPLARSDSLLEASIGQADPTTFGLLKGVGSVMLAALSQPVTAFTDEYQVAKIRELQAKFFEKHDGLLRDLSEDLGGAKVAMRQLANLMDEAVFIPSELERIMGAKRKAGDYEARRLDQAIAAAKTPEERQRLEAMKSDLDGWMAQRDERLAAEEPAYDLIHGKVKDMSNTVFEQGQTMREAADSPGPTTETGGQPGEPNRVLASSHTQPDAALHAASLHRYLLQTRAQMGGR